MLMVLRPAKKEVLTSIPHVKCSKGVISKATTDLRVAEIEPGHCLEENIRVGETQANSLDTTISLSGFMRLRLKSVSLDFKIHDLHLGYTYFG